MSQSKVYTIKSQNQVINSLILEIINASHEEAFLLDINGNYTMNDTYRQIIEMEMYKTYLIYHLEFPNLPYVPNPNLTVNIYNGARIDAYCKNGISYSLGIKTGFEELKNGTLYGKSIGYDIQDDGQIIYNPNGQTKKMKTNLFNKEDGTPYILKKGQEIEHDFERETGDLYYYLNDFKYEIELFFTIPHEMAHQFGFTSGIFEGLTENIAREVSYKYGLMNSPFARKDLVKLMQKIEKVIGRDTLVQYAHTYNEISERSNEISRAIDRVINPSQRDIFLHFFIANNAYEEYNAKVEDSIVARIKQGDITEDETYDILSSDSTLTNLTLNFFTFRDKLSEMLDSYIKQNPHSLFKLGETSFTGSDKDFEEVISFQQSEIVYLQQILNIVKGSN